MTEDAVGLNNKKKIILAIVFTFIICFGYAWWADSSRNNEIETTQDPSRLAYLALDFRDKDYKSSVISGESEIVVKFSLGEYSPANEITFLDEARYVYSKFFNRFKDKSITLVGEAVFTDIRGNKSTDKAFIIKFSPEQAKKIDWKNVKYLNLPYLALQYWKTTQS